MLLTKRRGSTELDGGVGSSVGALEEATHLMRMGMMMIMIMRMIIKMRMIMIMMMIMIMRMLMAPSRRPLT